jgi:hypothetical protein
MYYIENEEECGVKEITVCEMCAQHLSSNGNTNQNNTEISPHHQNGYHKQQNQKILLHCWWNVN